MSKIVDRYMKMDSLFQRCARNQYQKDFSRDDMRSYYTSIDDFVNTAKSYYFNDGLNLNSAVEVFNTDAIAQAELRRRLNREMMEDE